MLKYGIIIAVTVGMSVLDIVTGYLNAVIKGKVSSSTMRKGLCKKAVLLVVEAMSVLLQIAQGWVELGINVPVVTFVCGVILLMEVTSILENANKITNGKLKILEKILPKEKDDESK